MYHMKCALFTLSSACAAFLALSDVQAAAPQNELKYYLDQIETYRESARKKTLIELTKEVLEIRIKPAKKSDGVNSYNLGDKNSAKFIGYTEVLQERAEANEKDGQYFYGVYLLQACMSLNNGEHFPSYENACIDAVKAFETAAEQGNPNAMQNLGMMYKFKLAQSKSRSVVSDWYFKAASLYYTNKETDKALNAIEEVLYENQFYPGGIQLKYVIENNIPLMDGDVTCEEMEKFPALVFHPIDLGSGFGSPVSIDYYCPKNLSQLEFLKPLVAQADNLRGSSGLPQICTGSIVHARWRYHQFALLKMGYYPQAYDNSPVKSTKVSSYFEDWSYQSFHNRALFKTHLKEIERVRPLLVKWYQNEHGVTAKVATSYTEIALRAISGYGYDTVPSYLSKPALLPYTAEATEGRYKQLIQSLGSPDQKVSDTAVLNSLRRLLVHEAPVDVIQKVIQHLSRVSEKGRMESLLSVAIKNSKYVEILLNAGFSPNLQNEFGKTPLYYAIEFNQHDSVRLLLEQGADINHKYNAGYEDSWHCLGVTYGRTPLMHAAQHADEAMVQLLLDKGADKALQDERGSTAVDYAQRHEDKNMIKLITAKL